MAISTNADAFELQKKIMTMTGLWPYRTPTLLYKTFGLFNYILIVIFTVSLLMNIFVFKDVLQMIYSWFFFIEFLNCCIKILIFRLKTPVFLNLLDLLHSPHFTYYKEEFDSHLKRAIKFSTTIARLFLCFGVTTYVFVVAAPLFDLDFQRKRQTPFPFPIDLKQQPMIVYVFVFGFHCYVTFTIVLNVCGFDMLSTSLMGLSSCYFKILIDTIKEVTNSYILANQNSSKEMLTSYGNYDLVVNEELYKCVQRHIAIIKVTDAIENIFTYVFFSQFLCSVGGNSLAIFTLRNAVPRSFDYILGLCYLGTLTFQTTLYCSYGDEVTVQSSKIRDACYMTEWVYCGPSVRKTLFIIMERSKRPVVLTAGKFVDLSLESLVKIVRAAASYAAILRQLLNK